MNAYQLKHAMTRLDAVYYQKDAALKTALTPASKKVPKLTAGALIAGIKSGKITLGDGYDATTDLSSYSTRLGNVFDLTAYDKKPEQFDTAEYTKRSVPLKAEYERIKDQLILGDAPAALELIEVFAKAKLY